MFKLVTSVLVVAASMGVGVVIGESNQSSPSTSIIRTVPAVGWSTDTYVCTGVVCTDHK